MRKVILLTLYVILFSSCLGKQRKIEEERFAFGTLIKVIVYDSNEKKAKKSIQEAFEEIRRIDNKLNTRNENSVFSRINSTPINYITLDKESLDLLKEIDKAYEMSNGRYDISIAPLMDVWGFSEMERESLPKESEIAAAQKLVDYSSLVRDGNRIRFSSPGQKLDTGSFLKGYAISRAKEKLKSAGIKSAFISSISSIETIGGKPGNPWRIGIQNPENPAKIFKIMDIRDKAVGVSGDYQTYIEIKGEKYHHILDKNTGYPVRDKKMVVVVAENAFFADMLSTAFFSMEVEKVLKSSENLKNIEVLIVDDKMNLHYSEGMKKYIDL